MLCWTTVNARPSKQSTFQHSMKKKEKYRTYTTTTKNCMPNMFYRHFRLQPIIFVFKWNTHVSHNFACIYEHTLKQTLQVSVERKKKNPIYNHLITETPTRISFTLNCIWRPLNNSKISSHDWCMLLLLYIRVLTLLPWFFVFFQNWFLLLHRFCCFFFSSSKPRVNEWSFPNDQKLCH